MKRILPSLLLLNFVLCCFSVAQAKTIVISDIDDTLKVSRSDHSILSLMRAFNTSFVVPHMQVLFRALSLIPVAKFSYVSNAPSAILNGSHTRFLETHGFPEGEILLRDTLNDRYEHKRMNIQNIISEQAPNMVLFFGDNYHQDVEVYSEVASLYKGVISFIFIHDLTGVRQDIPGVFYYTSVEELASILEYEKILQPYQLRLFVQTIGSNTLCDRAF